MASDREAAIMVVPPFLAVLQYGFPDVRDGDYGTMFGFSAFGGAYSRHTLPRYLPIESQKMMKQHGRERKKKKRREKEKKRQ